MVELQSLSWPILHFLVVGKKLGQILRTMDIDGNVSEISFLL